MTLWERLPYAVCSNEQLAATDLAFVEWTIVRSDATVSIAKEQRGILNRNVFAWQHSKFGIISNW